MPGQSFSRPFALRDIRPDGDVLLRFAIATDELVVFPWALDDPDSQRFRAIV